MNPLKKFSDTFLDKNASHGKLRDCANELHKTFYEWANIQLDDYMIGSFSQNKWQNDVLLNSGKAISPFSAGMCILEYFRTTVFVRGIYKAIRNVIKTNKHCPVKILYAGTGPFAPLALLQTPYFSSSKIRFTFIDIHKESLECLKKIIKLLDLEHYVDSYIKQDAVEFNPGEQKFDIIITEVMQRALEKEPQVAVTANLINFLKPDGFFIPKSVTVSLAYLDTAYSSISYSNGKMHKSEKWINKTNLMNLDTNNLLFLKKDRSIKISKIVVPGYYNEKMIPYLLTDIIVYEDCKLTLNDCSLNLPCPVNLQVSFKPGLKLDVYYHINEIPGIELQKSG